jgi:colicin import membrane protein
MKFKLSIFLLAFSSIFFIDSFAGAKDPSPIDQYKIEVAIIIQKNWKVPTDQIAVKNKVVSSVNFKIMPDGTIKDVTVDKTSGNKILDDSAFKAVISSNPLPPHPKSISVPFINMSLRFTPYGLK